MDKSAANHFVYARASGILSRSYVFEKARPLYNFHTLPELWAFLYKEDVPVIPEAMLARELENHAFNVFSSEYIKLVNYYSSPHQIYHALLNHYDFENLKDVAAAIALNEKSIPNLRCINPFNIIDYKGWPSLEKMTKHSSLSWCRESVPVSEKYLLDSRIDSQYVVELFAALSKISAECREEVTNLIAEKLSIDNVIWMLRLKLYYQFVNEEIMPLLLYSDEDKRKGDILLSEVKSTKGFELDDYEKWSRWKYSKLLNPHEDAVTWKVDPRWISNSLNSMFMKKVYSLFHKYPFTECPLICLFFIKRNELDNIRTAVESIVLK